MILRTWRLMRRNTLCGFATVELPSGLVIEGIAVHVRGDRAWASPPARPILDENGHALRDDRGKIRYAEILRWRFDQVEAFGRDARWQGRRDDVPRCFSALDEDVVAFAEYYGGDIEFVRLAVTPDQAKRFQLQSAPPKATDRRRFEGSETWQLKALDPRELAGLVRAAIDERMDLNTYEIVLAEEAKARLDVLSRLGSRR
jgi:hypothetical protein